MPISCKPILINSTPCNCVTAVTSSGDYGVASPLYPTTASLNALHTVQYDDRVVMYKRTATGWTEVQNYALGGGGTDTDTRIEFNQVLPNGEWEWEIRDVVANTILSTFTTPAIVTNTVSSPNDTVDVNLNVNDYELEVIHTTNPDGSITLNDGTVIAAPIAETVTTLTGVQATGKTIGTYTNEAAAVVDIKETITSFASITNGYQFVSEDGTVYPFTFTFDNSTPSAPQLLINYGATTVSTIPLNSYDVNITTSGGFTFNPTTDQITITETDGETHVIDLTPLRTTLTSVDNSVEIVPSVNPDGSTNYDLGVKAHTNQIETVPYTGTELPTTAGVNVGDTKTVQFSDGTVVSYTWDGADWVLDFDTQTYKLQSCSGVNLAKDTKVHQVQNLTRATGFGVAKLDNTDCLGHDDDYYNADLFSYQGSSSQGNTATYFYSRVLNGQNTNAGGYMTIAGQRDNTSSSAYGLIFGRSNNSSSEYNTILGGSNNTNTANIGGVGRNFILNGSANNLTGTGAYSSILNGDGNTLSNSDLTQVYGTANNVNNVNSGLVFGGFNTINNTGFKNNYNFTFGSSNAISGSRSTSNNYSFGTNNQITNTKVSATIGEDNRLYDNLITSSNPAYLEATYSFGIGHRLRMYGKENFTLGFKLQTTSLKHIAIGFENVLYPFTGVDDDDLATSTHSKEIGYQLGIGAGGNNTDAHAVRKDGRQMFRALYENIGFTGAFLPSQTNFTSAFEFNTIEQTGTSAFGGVRLAPMTQAQRNAMSTSMYQDGDIVYCKDCINPDNGFNGVYQYYQASSGTWINMH